MFDNATKLTSDFLANELGTNSGFSPQLEKAKFNEYFLNICNYINEVFYLKPTPAQIEEFIETGSYKYNENKTVVCPLKKQEERKHLFLMAQAKQLLYDKGYGRGSMIRGEDKKFDICRDTESYIKMLNLYQRTYCTV